LGFTFGNVWKGIGDRDLVNLWRWGRIKLGRNGIREKGMMERKETWDGRMTLVAKH